MDIFKAHFIHPYTKVPLIIYFNKSEGHVTFETDKEKLEMLLGGLKIQFIDELIEIPNICKTQYPVKTFSEVYDLLEKLGVSKGEVEFKQLYVH